MQFGSTFDIIGKGLFQQLLLFDGVYGVAITHWGWNVNKLPLE